MAVRLGILPDHRDQVDGVEAEADDIEDAAEGDTDAMTEGLEEAVN